LKHGGGLLLDPLAVFSVALSQLAAAGDLLIPSGRAHRTT
jgi:hypothetical protein